MILNLLFSLVKELLAWIVKIKNGRPLCFATIYYNTIFFLNFDSSLKPAERVVCLPTVHNCKILCKISSKMSGDMIAGTSYL